MVLTDFKIDSKLNTVNAHKLDNWQSSKTDKKGKSVFDVGATDKSVGTSDDAKLVSKKEITDEKISELSSALHRIKQSDSADNVEAIEEDLRGLLSDMGLIDSELLKNKREAIKRDVSNDEDENLEQGANNIEVVKATHDPDKNDRKKRDGLTATTNIDVSVGSTADERLRSTEIKEGENEESKREATTAKINNYQSQGEVYVRNKRHEMSTENSDLMKGLEKSGELTVSGNKSPLASSENDVKITDKRKDSYVSTSSPTGVTTTGDDYEKQLEKNIQQRIEAIKEEVKREIASLQAKNTANTISEEEAQRKKRETSNTLVEKESKGLNPVEHPDGQLVPRVRTKRNLEGRDLHSRTKRGAYGDYFIDETGEEMDDPEIIENGEEDENEDYFLDTERKDSGFTNDSSTAYENSTEKVFSNNTTSTRSSQPPSIELNQTVSSPPTTLTSVPEMPHTGSVSDGLEDVTLKSSRKRREVIIHTRKKRAEALVPDGNAAYLPYRAEDEEVDEEGDEFEDDGFDDRTASLHKREANRNIPGTRYALDYLEYDEPYGTSDYQQKYPVRRYISNLNSNVYDNVPNFLHDPTAYIRRKRNNFDHLVALHGGGPMVRHLAATRERNMRQLENESRKKRNFRRTSQSTEDNKQEQQNIADLSDTDLFGALPQSYEGELSRFKRVKRKVAAVKGVG
ncbi:hypothetical protein RI129_003856 [Pyrocoelia pectoralis]|uniref:Uncharacterized protein n=1 Tax=Pyrocoelia pectoralis TaxID=417401 RepID=A0AAN7VSR3_9COLE